MPCPENANNKSPSGWTCVRSADNLSMMLDLVGFKSLSRLSEVRTITLASGKLQCSIKACLSVFASFTAPPSELMSGSSYLSIPIIRAHRLEVLGSALTAAFRTSIPRFPPRESALFFLSTCPKVARLKTERSRVAVRAVARIKMARSLKIRAFIVLSPGSQKHGEATKDLPSTVLISTPSAFNQFQQLDAPALPDSY